MRSSSPMSAVAVGGARFFLCHRNMTSLEIVSLFHENLPVVRDDIVQERLEIDSAADDGGIVQDTLRCANTHPGGMYMPQLKLTIASTPPAPRAKMPTVHRPVGGRKGSEHELWVAALKEGLGLDDSTAAVDAGRRGGDSGKKRPTR